MGLKEAKEKMNVLNLSKEDMIGYENDLESWRDYTSSMSTNFLAGELNGKQKEKTEMALKCLKKGMPINEIAELTGLSENEIQNIHV